MADKSNRCIQVFSVDGGFLRSFGIKESECKKPLMPLAICLSPDGLKVFVHTLGSSRLAVFSPEGQYLENWDFSEEMDCATSIVASSDGESVFASDEDKIYVCRFNQPAHTITIEDADDLSSLTLTDQGTLLAWDRKHNRVYEVNTSGGPPRCKELAKDVSNVAAVGNAVNDLVFVSGTHRVRVFGRATECLC